MSVQISIVRGNPTSAEEQAVRAAFAALARDEAAVAASDGGESVWVVSGRASAARTRVLEMPARTWVLSLRFDAGPMTTRRTGAGGAR